MGGGPDGSTVPSACLQRDGPAVTKLNVGCGPDYREGYVNIDGNAGLPRVEVVATLPEETLLDHFEPGSVDEILASDFIEHHSHWEAVKIMSDFYELLKPGGVLEMKLPDFQAIISSWTKAPEMKIRMLFGGQDVPGERDSAVVLDARREHPEFFCHKYAYTRRSMRAELEELGFQDVLTKRDGKNFVVTAAKP
jgi:hypothetical protein